MCKAAWCFGRTYSKPHTCLGIDQAFKAAERACAPWWGDARGASANCEHRSLRPHYGLFAFATVAVRRAPELHMVVRDQALQEINVISEARSLKKQLRDVAQPKAAQVPRQPICHCGLAEGEEHRQNSEELSGEVPQAWAAPARDAWGGVCLWWLGSLPFVVSGALAARPSWPYSLSQAVIAADRARPRAVSRPPLLEKVLGSNTAACSSPLGRGAAQLQIVVDARDANSLLA